MPGQKDGPARIWISGQHAVGRVPTHWVIRWLDLPMHPVKQAIAKIERHREQQCDDKWCGECPDGCGFRPLVGPMLYLDRPQRRQLRIREGENGAPFTGV